MSAETEYLQAGPVAVRVQKREGRITKLWLPLTPAQWADLGNKEGKYLGACCGNISHVRDVLVDAMREDGQINAADLRDVVETMAEHSSEQLAAETVEAWTAAALGWAASDPDDPFLTIGWIWFAVREQLDERREEPRELDPTDPAEALRMIDGDALVLSTMLMFFDDKDERPCRKAEITLAVARLLPAVRTLHAHLHELAPPPFEGYAVVLTKTGAVVGTRSPLIFATLAQLHRRVGRDVAREAGRLEIRHCKVNLAEGVVLGEVVPLETVEEPRADLEAAVAFWDERRKTTRGCVERWQWHLDRDERDYAAAVAKLSGEVI